MKNITFIVHSFDIDYMGGVLKITSQLANSLSQKGFHVRILSLGLVREPAFKLNDDVVLESLFIEKYSTQFYSRFFKLLWFKEMYKIFSLYLLKNSNDIFVLSSPPLNIIFSLLKLKSKDIYMVGCDHTSTSYKANSLIGRLKFLLYRKLDKFIALTESDNQFYCLRGVHSFYIPNFIDMKEHLVKNNNRNFLLFVGRFSSEKRPLLALKIYQNSRLWEKGIKLRMFGDGPLYHEMLQYLADNYLEQHVEILQKEVDPNVIYNDAYGLIMTSSIEGFGMVLLEAISRNIPCVAFDVDHGPRSIIKHGINGFLVKDDNLNSFNNYLQSLDNLISHTIRDSVVDFNIDQVVPIWIKLLSTLGDKA